MDSIEAIAIRSYIVGLVVFAIGFVVSFFHEHAGISIMIWGVVVGLFSTLWTIAIYLD